jgi:NAD(P) transhydrogenase subunit alpha
VLEAGEKRWPAPAMKKAEAPRPEVKAPPPAPVVQAPPKAQAHGHGHAARPPSRGAGILMAGVGVLAACMFLALRFGQADAMASPATVAFLQHLTVFVMAIFVGFQVVWNVTPALHTPLMSVTNAISGIIVVGGLLNARSGIILQNSVIVAVVATLFATINIAGGFLVTRRMLAMFRK